MAGGLITNCMLVHLAAPLLVYLCPHPGICILQGIHALVDWADDDSAANLLCQLYNHRASARLGLHKPAAALEDALASIRIKKKFAKGYLRAATCYIKMGQLTAAGSVLDKVKLTPSCVHTLVCLIFCNDRAVHKETQVKIHSIWRRVPQLL